MDDQEGPSLWTRLKWVFAGRPASNEDIRPAKAAGGLDPTMSRGLWVLLGAVCITFALAGCASASVNSEDIEEWRVAQQSASSGEVAAALSANLVAGGPSVDGAGEVTVDFDTPLTVKRIEFSCFGDGSMRAAAEARAGSNFVSAGLGTFDCSQSPHKIDVALFGGEPLDSFSFTGYDSTKDSAWYVTVHG